MEGSFQKAVTMRLGQLRVAYQILKLAFNQHAESTPDDLRFVTVAQRYTPCANGNKLLRAISRCKLSQSRTWSTHAARKAVRTRIVPTHGKREPHFTGSYNSLSFSFE